MGGAKKKGLAQEEKAQKLKEEKATGKRKGKSTVEKKVAAVGLPNFDDKNLNSELKKMKVITPVAMAAAYNVRVSAAKRFLKELSKKNMVSLVAGCRRLKIYKPVMA